MGLRDINIEKCYETTSKKTSLIDEFYIPVLSQSNLYLRIAGFFSSTSLVIVSKGLEALYHNCGKMKILISPELSEQDYSVLKNTGNVEMLDSIFGDFDIEKHASNDHLKLFAWMLSKGMIEIKIVVDKNSRNSLFHQKVGIFFDGNDAVSFSGSVNETAQAWLNNIEEFKTFKSWEKDQSEYLDHDIKKFNEYWENNRSDLAEVYDVPSSIIKRIINIKPKDINELNLVSSYKKAKTNEDNKLELFEHQKRAVNKWKNNGKKLLFEMATGTGKTRTAIGCILEHMKEDSKTVYIVSTPQNTLCRQWQDDIKKLGIVFDINKIIDGSNSSWKKDFEMTLLNINLGIYNNAILFTSHDLTCKSYFIDIIKRSKGNVEIMFICDEVHAMGAENFQKGLIEDYEYRIGLSATPDRMFDESGTELIKKYFGNDSFEFTIEEALKTINPLTKKPFLNEFCYIPKFVQLTSSEYKEYSRLNKRIAVVLNQEIVEEEELKNLRIKRSKIVKRAENKLEMFQVVIDELQRETRITDCITFVDEEHLDDVLSICTKNRISKAKITQQESTTKVVNYNGDTERQNLIKSFSNKNIQMLIGIKCLDEGIDIPDARIAILMASSINPREYVQRIGRVIRYAPNKKTSIIYDMIVFGDNEQLNTKEAKRAKYIAENAKNYGEVIREFMRNGVDIRCL